MPIQENVLSFTYPNSNPMQPKNQSSMHVFASKNVDIYMYVYMMIVAISLGAVATFR